MAHMFIIRPYDLDAMKTLFAKCEDGQFVILDENNGFADIAQYSARFNTVKIISVRADALQRRNELKIG